MVRSAGPSDLTPFKEVIRAAGLRATASRIAVLAHLRARATPLSHVEVASALEHEPWDRATIYRNLTDLARVGLVRRRDMGDHVWRFEAVDEGHPADEHPHFVCTDCGTVECLPGVSITTRKRARVPRAIRERRVEVKLAGICNACR